MTLQESEARLSEINAEINRLLKERKAVLKEWNAAFHTENPENITCVDDNTGGCHNLYLVNGGSRMQACLLSEDDMKGSLDDFYKCLETSIGIFNIANNREIKWPDYQKNLLYAKALEIREKYFAAGNLKMENTGEIYEAGIPKTYS